MKSRRYIPTALIILISAATFLPILKNDFVIQDDPEWISLNTWLNPPTRQHLLDIWRRPMQGLYVPVTYTLWSGLALIGTRPIVFHAASLILHVLSAWLVFRILSRLISNQWAALCGALLFAVHPMQVESVAWASGMKDVLGGLLSLVMIDQYLCYISDGMSTPRANAHYGAAIAALALGLLAKPSAVMAPAIAGAIDVMLVRHSFSKMIERLWPMLLLVIPCIFWSRWVQESWAETITPLWTRPFIAGDALAFYVEKLFWPTKLAAQYGRTPQGALESSFIYLIWLIPICAGSLIWIAARNFPAVRCGMLIFVLGVLPVLGFMTFMFQLNSTVADHYVYLAMLGPALAVAELITQFATSSRLAIISISTIVIVVLMNLAIAQQGYWKDSIALFSRSAEINPKDPTAQGKLGLALAQAGQFEQAIPHFQSVVEARPDSSMAWFYLGRALEVSGQLNDANRVLMEAVHRFPSDEPINVELQTVQSRLNSSSTKP